MSIKKSFLLFFLPAALFFQACGPENVINPVTPVNNKDNSGDDDNQGKQDPPVSGDNVSMTVCTFNIRYANNDDTYPGGASASWSIRKDPIKKFIDATKPDLIGLQEIRQSQSQWFSSTFGSEYGYYDVNRDNSSGSSVGTSGGEGVGLMYKKDRFDLVLKDFFWLDDEPRTRPAQNSDKTYGAWSSACRRVTVYAELKDKKHGNSIVWFFPTHYDHKSDEARTRSAEMMVTQMKNLCKVSDLKDCDPVIIHVGDLNTTSDKLSPLNNAMHYARLEIDGTDKYTATFVGFDRSSNKIIDHIYYGGKSVKPLKYWVDNTDYGVPVISDHVPVLFQWEYKD